MVLPETMTMDFLGEDPRSISSISVFWSVLIGLGVGGAISYLTFYTGKGKKPVMDIVAKSAKEQVQMLSLD